MKKQSIFFYFFLMILLAGCGLETNKLPEFYEKELDDVTKVFHFFLELWS